MSQSIYPVPAHIKDATLIDKNKYNTLYKQSIDDPESFWREHGKRLDWSTPYTKVKNTSLSWVAECIYCLAKLEVSGGLLSLIQIPAVF